MIEKIVCKGYLVSLLCCVILLTGCATLAPKPEKPTIKVLDVRPLNLNLNEQRIRFRLKVINPNAFDMPVDSVDFVARFNGDVVASGKNKQSVTIPANGEGILALDVTAGLQSLLDSFKGMLADNALDFEYDIDGTVKVDNWPTPIPFDFSGALQPLPES